MTAYAVSAPFWIAAVLILVDVFLDATHHSYITNGWGCCTPIMLFGGAAVAIMLAGWTKSLIQQNPNTLEFALEVFTIAFMLLMLDAALWIGFEIATFRFLDTPG